MTAETPEMSNTSAPELPEGRIPLQAPPDRVESGGFGNILATVLPMIGSMGVMVFMALSQSNNPRMLVMAGSMVVAMLSMVGINIYRQISGHRQKVMTTRREYLAYLTEMRETVRTAARKQRTYVSWMMPDPDALILVAEDGARLWEREASSPDVLAVRLGTAPQPLSMEMEVPELPPLADPDVVCHSALTRFVDTHSEVDNLAMGTSIGACSHIEVVGDAELARSEVRAMVAHLATFVSPALLTIAVLCPEERRADWEWLKWLPHARSSEKSDALGPSRMIVSDYEELAELLGEKVTTRASFRPRDDMMTWPHVLVVLDQASLPTRSRLGSAGGTAGVTVVSMPSTWGAITSPTLMRLVLHPGAREDVAPSMEILMLDHMPVVAKPDSMDLPQAEALARRLTRWSEDEGPDTQAPLGRPDPKRSADLMDLLAVGDIRDFDPNQQWKRREGRERLRVAIGVTPEGVPVELDIKESAEEGMGPHGLLIGATGSGKSEVLRTLVLALALTHSPEQLNFVLVDFKGGATFAGMAQLPHVSAMISNLESELSLVDRMQDALRGEMVRRQEVLRQAGNYANVNDYEADRRAGKHSFAPLPALFIVLDEFSELLSAKPEFIDIFVAIGRLGRSLSIHLLLASQRLEEGKLRGLDSHLSYRIGLRTFSAGESRSVLGVGDAYELPSIPGVGYLKPGTDEMIRFRASYVAAPPPPRRAESDHQPLTSDHDITILPFTSRPVLETAKTMAHDDDVVPSVDTNTPVLPGDAVWTDMTEMDIAIARMEGHGMGAHQIWLPPLDVPDTLDALMPDLATDPERGLFSRQWRDSGILRVPLGTIDLPAEQRRETLVVDLSGAGGHMAVIGGPLTGKSTALRSLVMALSLTHTPQEVQFYIMDFGGGGFASFDGAPHVAGVATRDRTDIVNRMILEIESIIDDREKYFRQHRIDSMTTYREGHARGQHDDGYGDIFLVVDGWSTLRNDFDGMDTRIQTLLPRALTFGVHLVLATNRWADLRQQVSDVMGTELELKLGDSADSRRGRKLAEQVPDGRPGRGLEVGGHHMMITLPRIDRDHDGSSLGRGVRDSLDWIDEAWNGPRGPKLRLLPTHMDISEARALPGAERGMVLGVEESRLHAWTFDPAHEDHLYLMGDAKSGKTTFLRSIIQEITRTHSPQEAQIFTVDVRRALLDQIPDEYNGGYFTSRDETESALDPLATYLESRLPGNSVSAEELRTRSWWKGAEAWVIVDDYDLVATRSGNPLAILQPLLTQSHDIGLHLIIARRMGGASRALYEPILQTFNELGVTGILLSGDPEEGAVIGRIRPVKSAPGRAQIISRDAGHVIAQLAWAPPRTPGA